MNYISLNDLTSFCDSSIILEREVETKRSKRDDETKDAYKAVKALTQKVRFELEGVTLREIFERAISSIVVTYQNGTSRPACDKLDTDSGHTGNGWEGWLKANPSFTIKVSMLKSGGSKAEIPIEQRIAAMSAEQLASSMTEDQLNAALKAMASKRGGK